MSNSDVDLIVVGVRSDAVIELEFKHTAEPGSKDDHEDWDFSTLTLEQASFLYAELNRAMDRAAARQTVLDERKAHSALPSK